MGKIVPFIVAVALLSAGSSLRAQQDDSHSFGANPNASGTQQPALPPQLVALKSQFQSDSKAAMAPILDRYKKALQALMKTATQNGDLDGALAVRQELRRLDDPRDASNTLPGAPAQMAVLESQFFKEGQAAGKPIADRYVAALRELMKTLTQSGNLDDAAAVEQELNGFVGSMPTAEKTQASFAGTVWETPHDKGSKDFSRITFRKDGTWAEAYKANPLRGHWKQTQDASVVEVRISNGDVIHFKMSDDGTTCTRQEAVCTWQKKEQPAENQ